MLEPGIICVAVAGAGWKVVVVGVDLTGNGDWVKGIEVEVLDVFVKGMGWVEVVVVGLEVVVN